MEKIKVKNTYISDGFVIYECENGLIYYPCYNKRNNIIYLTRNQLKEKGVDDFPEFSKKWYLKAFERFETEGKI